MRVAIVGFAPSWVDAPFADPAIEIWTMNYHHTAVPRTSRIFEMHDWAIVEKEGHAASLRAATVPVYLQQARPDVPTSVTYPIARITAAYPVGGIDRPYCTSTAAYMVALAIEEGVTDLSVFGIDLSHDTEYGTQRPSCEFWLGLAVGKGIAVSVHPASNLLKTAFLYGYEDAKRDVLRETLAARHAYLAKMHAEHTAEAAKHTQAAHEFAGAIQDNDHIRKVWAS